VPNQRRLKKSLENLGVQGKAMTAPVKGRGWIAARYSKNLEYRAVVFFKIGPLIPRYSSNSNYLE
jgi:hypothetical protein